MATTQNISQVVRYFAEVDRGNLDIMDELCAADYAAHFPGLQEPLDRQAAKTMFAAFIAAFPGLAHRIDAVTAEQDKVTARLWITGVHGGEFMGVPASGKAIGFAAINTFQLASGMIMRHWIEFEAQELLQQLT